MRHIVILGNGIAGITAARELRKLGDDRITVISAETDYFFSRTALMYVYMGQLEFHHTKPYEDWFWQKNRIELLRAQVRVAKSKGIMTRYWDLPAWPISTRNGIWRQLRTEGVDLLNADDLVAAAGFSDMSNYW